MDILGEVTARKKYGTATLRERSAELGITMHDEDEIEALLAEGEDATMRSKLTEEELDYRKVDTQSWGLEEAEPSTGWDTIEDTAPPTITQIYPEAHIKAMSYEHGEVLREAMRKVEQDVHWLQCGHPNMVIPAPTTQTAGPSTGNRYTILPKQHA
jgi:hypothetical protein